MRIKWEYGELTLKWFGDGTSSGSWSDASGQLMEINPLLRLVHMNQLGAEGWEIASVETDSWTETIQSPDWSQFPEPPQVHKGRSVIFTLKRPVEP